MKIKTLPLAISLIFSTSFVDASTLIPIDNYGFEDGLDGWIVKGPGFISTQKKSGSQSLRVSGKPGRVSQWVDLERDTRYQLQAWVKGKGQIFINSRDDGPGFKNKKFDEDSWTLIKLPFSSGDATETEFGAKFTDVEHVRFDDFKVLDLDSDTPTPTTSPTPTPSSGGSSIPSNITNGSIFDLEGDNPNPLINSRTLRFVPLQAQVTTSNGNGWRHEYKIKSSRRISMTDTYEVFEASVRVDMSDGGKSIIAQHHAGDTGTIMKVYVSDTDESGFDDSRHTNGIFDVYVRLRNTDGDEEKYALGTIRSGDSFSLKVINNYGEVDVSALGRTFGIPVEDDSESYFKFGNYLQSQDPDGTDDCGKKGNSDSFRDCYKDFDITESTVTMTNVSYTRIEND